jgi:hypothetical protein
MDLKNIGNVFTSKLVGPRAFLLLKKNLLGGGLKKVEKHCCRVFICAVR